MDITSQSDITGRCYITVRNWEKFQHYRDRRPVWIKLYTELLQDPDYLELSLASRGLLSTIWLVRARTGEAFQLSSLRTASRQPIYSTQLISLSEAGFIDISASKPLAPNKEVEKEKETPSPLRVVKPIPNRRAALHNRLLEEARQIAASSSGNDSDRFAEALDAIERKHHARLSHIEREQLWESIINRR